MYSPVLIEMLVESRLAEVAAAAERRGSEHKPVGDPHHQASLAWSDIRDALAASIPHRLSVCRALLHTLRGNPATANEPGN